MAATVRARRLASRLTQREAAAKAGVSLATWQSVERAGATTTAFQELTLARVAHGVGLELEELVAEAGGPRPAGGPGRTDGAADVHTLVDDVGRSLLRLAAVSEEAFHLVAGQALEAADRFLQVLEE